MYNPETALATIQRTKTNKTKGGLSRMYNPETALGTIQRTKTNKTKGVIKNVQSRGSIGHNTKNKDKQNKRGNQECTIQRQHWAQYKEQRQTKQKG